MQNKKFFAEVKEVHSGDDLILMVDLGIDGLFKKARCRLAGVDTPDAYRSDGSTEAGKVRDYVKSVVKTRRCYIEVLGERRNSWLITLFVEDDGKLSCLNKVLMDQGYVFDNPKSPTFEASATCPDPVTQQIAEAIRNQPPTSE